MAPEDSPGTNLSPDEILDRIMGEIVSGRWVTTPEMVEVLDDFLVGLELIEQFRKGNV